MIPTESCIRHSHRGVLIGVEFVKAPFTGEAPIFVLAPLRGSPAGVDGCGDRSVSQRVRGDAERPCHPLGAGGHRLLNANLCHRGWNPEGRKRWTLHCAFWSTGATGMDHEHGQREAPLTRQGHLERMPPVTRKYIQRNLDCYPERDPPSLFDL